ncbi:unnamed protein product [Mytilus edulis]|uniref:Uncharacterized protein n=1 Tax=Mytilus edulis TaxID=6550 RepID=A0A8S3UBJ4_MYTED|nr:unnamed protein product [Mytilus edulis]
MSLKMVKSLFQQALDFVGDHQKIFKLNSITALPCHVQEKFLQYLSAHDLYILSEQHPHNLNALILDEIWNLHVQRRWSRAQIVMNIFHETGLNENAKLVYLQKYFLEILSYCSINLNTVDAESEDMVNHIVKKLEGHQLTHLVIDDANLHRHSLERLLHTFRNHYRISQNKKISHRPLELLDFQACLKSLSADDFVPFEEKCQLETLGLSGNKVREDEVESELIKFMANNKRLQTLILNYSRLRCQFVDSDIFLETVLTHPCLRELSIKNNHLKETVCRLLKRVCCAQNHCVLRSLNIGYNWVKGAELVETAQEIIAFRKSHQMFGPVLDFLCLSGNRLHLSDSSQSRLWNVFDGLVKDLEVDRIDYNRPFDEHLAQM